MTIGSCTRKNGARFFMVSFTTFSLRCRVVGDWYGAARAGAFGAGGAGRAGGWRGTPVPPAYSESRSRPVCTRAMASAIAVSS
jgi:hypothetical protein